MAADGFRRLGNRLSIPTQLYIRPRYNGCLYLIRKLFRMNIHFYRCALSVLLAAAALPAGAATYICQVDGRAVFTTEKLGSHCQLSSMNGISDDAPTAATENSASAPGSDNIAKIWEKEQFGRYDDVKILPSRPSGVTNTAEAAAPSLNVKLRNQARAKSSVKSKSSKPRTPAPVIAPPKPQLGRKQILQNEVRNEQTALVRAKAQLNVARKKGDKAKAARLEQEVRDREANISAIRSEMTR